MTDETRAKFAAAIADKVGADRIEEVHLFPTIRQGGTESGVAVVAVRIEDRYPMADVSMETSAETEPVVADGETTPPHGDPLLEGREPSVDVTSAAEDRPSVRLTVYTAKYRLTVKGPERGKWEFAIQAEADAPLLTVETVVRGVQRRSGDIDDPAKLGGDEFRSLLGGPST